MEFFDQSFNNYHFNEEDILQNHRYENCQFIHCQLSFSKIQHCEFIECEFIECQCNTLKTIDVLLRDCTFEKCHLIGIDWLSLTRHNPLGHPIEKIHNCLCKYHHFSELSLIKMDFTTNEWIDCEFISCNLSKSNFSHCNLTQTLFIDNQLKETNFEYSTGFILDLTQNHISKTKFSAEQARILLSSFDIQLK